jgi:AcrR family transcriptional regulator
MAIMRQNGEQRREQILDAALRCFDERGLVETGIEDIRKAAGASPSSIYHLFGGLPEVIAALLDRTFVRRFADVTAVVVKTKTAKSAVETMVREHLRWVFANEAEARFMYRAIALGVPGVDRGKLRERKEQLKAQLLAHLKKLGALPETRGVDALIDVALLGATHQACRQWLSASGSVERKWMLKTLPQLAWQGSRTLRSHR